mmetsp:Transcript_19462/g.30433  ORF Transcript_19462/g.30433 Transcript_19462/m.30433 type:complete len:99 (+) Transcript_19462:155-451(+)
MARGDQRERDRAKKQARLQKEAKGGGSKEGKPEQRNLADSAALAAKVAKKAELKKKQEEEEQRMAGNKPVVARSKVKKKEPAGLDDLLSAGLAKTKKK